MIRRAAASAAAAICAVLAGTGLSQADLAVKGDQAAWGEVMAAYQKLYALPGFRITLAAAEGAQMTMEVVPPDSYHTIMKAGSGTMETVSVKGQARFRMNMAGAPSGWQCQGMPPMQTPKDPLKEVQGTVEVSRGPDTVVEGAPVRTYDYTTTMSAMGQGSTVKNTLYVGTQTGLPRRSVVTVGGHESTFDYYDYGAKIDIVLPPCG